MKKEQNRNQGNESTTLPTSFRQLKDRLTKAAIQQNRRIEKTEQLINKSSASHKRSFELLQSQVATLGQKLDKLAPNSHSEDSSFIEQELRNYRSSLILLHENLESLRKEKGSHSPDNNLGEIQSKLEHNEQLIHTNQQRSEQFSKQINDLSDQLKEVKSSNKTVPAAFIEQSLERSPSLKVFKQKLSDNENALKKSQTDSEQLRHQVSNLTAQLQKLDKQASTPAKQQVAPELINRLEKQIQSIDIERVLKRVDDNEKLFHSFVQQVAESFATLELENERLHNTLAERQTSSAVEPALKQLTQTVKHHSKELDDAKSAVIQLDKRVDNIWKDSQAMQKVLHKQHLKISANDTTADKRYNWAFLSKTVQGEKIA